MKEFYFDIEEKVRKWVRLLRNAGINTECSCEHEGYIQCQSLDPSFEIDTIRKVFLKEKLFEYKITITYTQGKEGYSDWHQVLMIESPEFKKD